MDGEIVRSVRIDDRSGDVPSNHFDYDITFENLNLKVKNETAVNDERKALKLARFNPVKRSQINTAEKTILSGITGVFRKSRFTAIMGPSGAGKTSLLTLISGQLPKSDKTSGTIRVGSLQVDYNEMKNFSGFVFQDDVILATMTVEEALKMSAILRLPKGCDHQERVDSMIQKVQLEKAKRTQIGESGGKKGISGGERKRTSIAMELITEPKVLFLDEPTSGLDSDTAHSICKLLAEYAHSGHTVVATIHQPSSDIYKLFDDLLLLHEGRVVYYGDARGAVEYFEKAFAEPFPLYSNPADHIFMHILRSQRITNLSQVWLQSENFIKLSEMISTINSEQSPQLKAKYKSDFWTQFKFLTNRASKNAIRNELIIRVRLFQSIFIGVLAGLVFMNATDGSVASQIQSLSGVLYFLSVNQFFGSATAVLSIFATEKLVFMREYRAGYYGLTAYYFSKALVELPYQIIFPALLLIIAYYMIGLNPAFSAYLLASALLIFCAITGTAIGTFISAMFDDVGIALAVLPLFLLPVLLFSGLFVNSENFPVWLAWLQYASPVRYSFSGLLQNQFSSYTFNNCNATIINCSGQRALDQLGFGNDLPVGVLISILAGIYLIFVLLGYLVLLYKIKRR